MARPQPPTCTKHSSSCAIAEQLRTLLAGMQTVISCLELVLAHFALGMTCLLMFVLGLLQD
jgi:hypothetical protein